MQVDFQTSQNTIIPNTVTTGGIHTNDGTTVKQYFNYYAKLANQ